MQNFKQVFSNDQERDLVQFAESTGLYEDVRVTVDGYLFGKELFNKSSRRNHHALIGAAQNESCINGTKQMIRNKMKAMGIKVEPKQS